MKTTAAHQLENASAAPRARRLLVSRERQTIRMRCLGFLSWLGLFFLPPPPYFPTC